jgi:hypothetical protein
MIYYLSQIIVFTFVNRYLVLVTEDIFRSLLLINSNLKQSMTYTHPFSELDYFSQPKVLETAKISGNFPMMLSFCFI